MKRVLEEVAYLREREEEEEEEEGRRERKERWQKWELSVVVNLMFRLCIM